MKINCNTKIKRSDEIQMNESKIYSCEYQFNGETYVMHLYGNLEEVTHHADALGLSEPEPVEAIVPEFAEWRH
jgi:hypothetical protein